MAFAKGYSELYNLFYQEKDYDRECDCIENIFSKFSKKPKTILDLGCGTGGHVFPLIKRGYQVTGIDKSEFMLNTARKKAKEKNLSIQFTKGDITKIKVEKKYDAIISMFAVVGYQTLNSNLEALFSMVNSCLDPGGLFIFDCWYGPAVLHQGPECRISEISLNDAERVIRLVEPYLDVINHLVHIKYKILLMKKNRLLKTIEETHDMRFFFPQEIKYYLERSEFKGIFFYPFPDLNRNLTVDDWNVLVVGKK